MGQLPWVADRPPDPEAEARLLSAWAQPHPAARALGIQLSQLTRNICSAESCTGGLLGELITDVPGSSAWYRGGVVAYADEVKSAALGVDPAVIARHGAVSPEVARQMAQGARTRFGAHLALAITGIAGPEGGTREKPVGLVWVGAAWVDAGGREFAAAARRFFASDRIGNRRLAAIAALEAASQIAAEFLS